MSELEFAGEIQCLRGTHNLLFMALRLEEEIMSQGAGNL